MYKIKFVFSGGQYTLKLPARFSMAQVEAFAQEHAATLKALLKADALPVVTITPPVLG